MAGGALAGACLLAAAGCSGVGSGVGDRYQPRVEGRAATEDSIVLVVRSAIRGSARIYVRNDGHRTRLGRVIGGQTAAFRVPPEVIAGARRLRIVADPVGSRGPYTSELFSVMPGDSVEWSLYPGLPP